MGKSVYIRFHACSDDGTNSGGMYVDDVYPVPAFANRAVINNNINDTLYAFTGKPDGRYYYRVRGHNAAWDWGAQGPLSAVDVGSVAIGEKPGQPDRNLTPERTEITAAFPSPFAAALTVSYSLARPGPIRVSVYSSDGRLVRRLAEGVEESGRYRTRWDGRDERRRPAPDGVYVIRLEADRVTGSRVLRLNQPSR